MKDDGYRLDHDLWIRHLVRYVRDEATRVRNVVQCDLETPRFACLMFLKWSRGIVEAVIAASGSTRSADRLQRAIDEEATRIDPGWCHPQRRRLQPRDYVERGNIDNAA